MTWTQAHIPWDDFKPDQVNPTIVPIVKTAALIEANSASYVAYLQNVFSAERNISKAIDVWGQQEYQHGLTLGRWAALADPSFSFFHSLDFFRKGYQIPAYEAGSTRGSPVGELLARCVVEAGTTSFYTALYEQTSEPCLKQICLLIAQDERSHYRLFRALTAKYYHTEYDAMPIWDKIKTVVGRATETDDDEIAYAYYSAHDRHLHSGEVPYDREKCSKLYFSRIYRLYQKKHIELLVRLMVQAIGNTPNSPVTTVCSTLTWGMWSLKKYASWSLNHQPR
ncbi:ferritin-like domain-containing protein [Paremcibacter congregatus]|uniref:ferritin-like domain-containing protein n=1 Tax=Paremcibacter congregatus TaxID=2043170 RepID=UPI0030EDA3B6|tara:strand:+ start:2546 stop:3388 length:843 start_codon:yes stop_codon:yes gene_type:complete